MRHVIYLLVVVNLIYFSWNMLQNVPHKVGASLIGQLSPNVRRLETVQESAAKKASTTGEHTSDMSGGSSVVASPSGDAEAQQATADINLAQTLTAAEPPGAITPSLNCHILGPFPDNTEIKSAEARLYQLGYKPRVRTSTVQVENGYWVYLPTMEREAALRITRILKQNNDMDYLILKDNAISLGVYDSPSRVDVRLKMLHKYGIEAVVEPRHTTRSVHWLDLDQRDDELGVLETIRDEYPDVEARNAACE
jgi:hypothetical protein